MKTKRVIEWPVITEADNEVDARVELDDMGVIDIVVDGKIVLSCDWENNFEKVVLEMLREWL